MVVFGSALFILGQLPRRHPEQKKFLAVGVVVGIMIGFAFEESHSNLVQILTRFTPWTLLGGQMLSLMTNEWWWSAASSRGSPQSQNSGLCTSEKEKVPS